MYVLLVQPTEATKLRTQQYTQLKTLAKEIQQLNSGGPTTDTTSGPNSLIYR